ncbi:MAG: hypothetical protein ACRD2J_02760 [Thermoanaerobaculia bacterium]
MKRPAPPAPPGGRRVDIGPEELAGLVLQSILFAAALAFIASVLLARLTPLPRPLAFGIGLEAGLLSSYPTMRIVARANGAGLGFGTWAAVTIVPTALGVAILAVV